MELHLKLVTSLNNMSTYYKFVCKEHNTSGGFLSRQAWGKGNIDIIMTFKFLALHMDCQPYLVSEDEKDWGIPEEVCIDIEKFLKDTHGMMPHSNDWALQEKNDWKDVEDKWEEEIRKYSIVE